MRITATPRAVEVIERCRAARPGTLTVTIGTGCCESTAPFLYEDFWPGPDQQPIGEVAGVTVYAPDYLRDLYPDDDAVVLDAHTELAESMSVETEFGFRFILRGDGFDSSTEPRPATFPPPPTTSSARSWASCPRSCATSACADPRRPTTGRTCRSCPGMPELLRRVPIGPGSSGNAQPMSRRGAGPPRGWSRTASPAPVRGLVAG